MNEFVELYLFLCLRVFFGADYLCNRLLYFRKFFSLMNFTLYALFWILTSDDHFKLLSFHFEGEYTIIEEKIHWPTLYMLRIGEVESLG